MAPPQQPQVKQELPTPHQIQVTLEAALNQLARFFALADINPFDVYSIGKILCSFKPGGLLPTSAEVKAVISARAAAQLEEMRVFLLRASIAPETQTDGQGGKVTIN